MRKFCIFALIVAFCGGVEASWYWPFGSDEVDEKPKRISELIEPASRLIDEGADLAAEGKVDGAVEKYRKALLELDRIEMENPERAKSAEFATLRNKRAYVNAAIDALLFSQVQANAKTVAVSDTTELERRLDRERWSMRMEKAKVAFARRDPDAALAELEKARTSTTNAVMMAMSYQAAAGAYCQKGAFQEACRVLVRSRQALFRAGVLADADRKAVAETLQAVRSVLEPFGTTTLGVKEVNACLVAVERAAGIEDKQKTTENREAEKKAADKSRSRRQAVVKPQSSAVKPQRSAAKPRTKRERALAAIAAGDWTTAERVIGEMLVEKPNGAVALNLKAAMEARQGNFKAAESTLDQAIMSNPRNHFAYYNMANLMLQARPDEKSIARRYYETGRAFGGPIDAQLEEALK